MSSSLWWHSAPGLQCTTGTGILPQRDELVVSKHRTRELLAALAAERQHA